MKNIVLLHCSYNKIVILIKIKKRKYIYNHKIYIFICYHLNILGVCKTKNQRK